MARDRGYQDLVPAHEFGGSCDSVWRFVRKLERVLDLPFRRIEVELGTKLQVDFGQGAWVVENGKRRRPHLFWVVLSHRPRMDIVVEAEFTQGGFGLLDFLLRYSPVRLRLHFHG